MEYAQYKGKRKYGANIIECLKCSTILESTHVHDFQQCECDNHTFTDGGLDYQRYGGREFKYIYIIATPYTYDEHIGFPSTTTSP